MIETLLHSGTGQTVLEDFGTYLALLVCAVLTLGLAARDRGRRSR